MALTITLLGHAGAAPEIRRIARGTFGIGRGPDNDWVLPDPDRHLSKRHCLLSWQGEFWQVTDLSTNGTFLNGEPAPVGQGQVRDLRDGDRLMLGAYEMELRIVEDWRVPAPSPLPRAAAFLEDSLLIDPSPSFGDPVQPDHRAAVEDAFIPPRPIALIGDDWDLDVPGAAEPPAPSAQPALKPILAAQAIPAPSPVVPPDAGAAERPVAEDLLAAFFRGAGVTPPSVADPGATLETLGAAFRAMVGGLRATLIARAAVKSEFRIEQTIIRARGNNSPPMTMMRWRRSSAPVGKAAWRPLRRLRRRCATCACTRSPPWRRCRARCMA